MNKLFYTILILVLPVISIECQIIDREHFIQVDGLVFDRNGKPIANVNIISFRLVRGSISEGTGVYSIISIPGDTLLFSAIGFKKTLLKVPLDISGNRFTTDIMLDDDTINIENVVILPWKTYDEFKRAVLNYEPNSVETKNMNINIALIRKSIQDLSIKSSPEAGYRYAMQQNYNSLMTKNQYPVNNLLNPFAWAKFFKGVKNGMFKSEPPIVTNSSTFKKKVKVKKVKTTKD